jgi:glyceraldehyde-3-phosphate dehydrogenase (NAD(P))
MTDKRSSNLIFSFGRDHGYYGRILSQTVVVTPTLMVRKNREIYGFCFTPQDGNSLVSSIAAALWLIDPDPASVAERLAPIRRFVFREI